MQGLAKGAVRSLALSLAAVLGLALPALAQTTGKIEGRVRDAQSGQPLAGAQVLVTGTTLGNITNEDGYYFINNVPAGLHDVRAQYIGYQTVTVSEQRVLSGQTMTVNFQMTPSAVELEPITVQGESNPLIPRDKTVSKAIVTGDVVEQLPVDDANSVIVLQQGVVDFSTPGGMQDNGVVIRGGRPGEASVYVDGVLVRNFNQGAQSLLEVGTNAVEEINVLLGGFGAEYGSAQSGIINYVTKTGGTDYSGAFSFGTDEILPNDMRYGISRMEASFGGPITENSSFHLALTAQGAEDVAPSFMDDDIMGADSLPMQRTWFRPVAGADGRHQPILSPDGDTIGHAFEPMEDMGNRRPWANQDEYNASATLRFSPFENTKLNVGLVRYRNQGMLFNDDYQFRPKAMPAFRTTSNLYRIGVEQTLLQTAERQAVLKVSLAYGNDDSRLGQLADTTALEPGGPDMLGFRFDSYEFLFEDFTVDAYMARLDSVKAGLATDPLVPGEVLGWTSQEATQILDRSPSADNPYGSARYWGKGFYADGGYRFSLENTMSLDVDLDFQANLVHRFGAGLELYKKNVENISSTGFGSISGYDTYFQNVYETNPTIGALYVKDRMDIGEMVIDAGLRFDFFDSDAQYPVIPGLIYPYQDGETVVTPEFTTQEMIWSVSPRLGVAFPISEVTNFRLSYGHFFQVPDFNDLFNAINTDISKTNTNTAFGRPIDPMKSIQFEAGLSHMFGSGTVLDLTAYNKDKLADVAYRIGLIEWPDARRGAQDGRILTGLDFGNVRGMDIRLTRRLGSYFTAIGGYSLLDARSTGSDPYSYINSFGRFADPVTGAPLSPAQALHSTDFDQTHKVNLAATANLPADFMDGSTWNSVLRNTDIALTVQSGSGFPFTRSSTPDALARGGGNSARYTELENASRMDWQLVAYAKVTRGFNVGGRELAAFVDVRNLLNTRNVMDVYSLTGSPTDMGDIESVAGGIVTGDQAITATPQTADELKYARMQQLLDQYGLSDADPNTVTNAEQAAATGLAYVADRALYSNFGLPRRFRLGFEFIF